MRRVTPCALSKGANQRLARPLPRPCIPPATGLQLMSTRTTARLQRMAQAHGCRSATEVVCCACATAPGPGHPSSRAHTHLMAPQRCRCGTWSATRPGGPAGGRQRGTHCAGSSRAAAAAARGDQIEARTHVCMHAYTTHTHTHAHAAQACTRLRHCWGCGSRGAVHAGRTCAGAPPRRPPRPAPRRTPAARTWCGGGVGGGCVCGMSGAWGTVPHP